MRGLENYSRSFGNYGEKRYAIVPDGDSLRVMKVMIVQTISHKGIVKFYECNPISDDDIIDLESRTRRVPKKMVGRDRRQMEKLAFTLSLKGEK